MRQNKHLRHYYILDHAFTHYISTTYECDLDWDGTNFMHLLLVKLEITRSKAEVDFLKYVSYAH